MKLAFNMFLEANIFAYLKDCLINKDWETSYMGSHFSAWDYALLFLWFFSFEFIWSFHLSGRSPLAFRDWRGWFLRFCFLSRDAFPLTLNFFCFFSAFVWHFISFFDWRIQLQTLLWFLFKILYVKNFRIILVFISIFWIWKNNFSFDGYNPLSQRAWLQN